VTLLVEPRDGVPPVVDTAEALDRTVAAFAGGSGPVAVDAERASGYRYSGRAYLVQLRRRDTGTALVDPIACPDLSSLGAAIVDAEWVLHAASQDLACLAEVGLRPRALFDTELAGRLAGFERVGLAAILQTLLGVELEKGHGAADWSRRPLPTPWLAYAALDVELLVELRDALAAELDRQGKRGWAAQEFAAVQAAPPPAPRAEPWRRTSGIHRVRGLRQLAGLREVWTVRDRIARDSDTAPGRVVPDSALVAAANRVDDPVLRDVPGFTGRRSRRYARQFEGALKNAAALPDAELPRNRAGPDGPPPTGRWRDRDPAAAGRLAAVRETLAAIGAEHAVPAEHLLPPDAVRRIAWGPPQAVDEASVAAALGDLGAREWQVRLVAGAVARALAAGQPNVPAGEGSRPG
jgi:ribonuclease D